MAQTLAVPASAQEQEDPLLAAINHFRAAGDLYDDLSDDLDEEQEAIEFERLCDIPEQTLASWRQPATSRESAAAALQLAIDQLEAENEPVPLVLALLRAALRFVEGWRQ